MFRHQVLVESWLGHSLRPNQRGEVLIKCLCPEHEDRHPSFALNLGSGLWHCFGCGRSGNIYQLAELLGKRVGYGRS